MATWHSNIRLLTGTGLTDRDKAYFGGASAVGWLQGKTLQAFENQSYQRTEGRLWARLDINYEKALFADYIMYQNTDISTEWLVGKITSKRYISLNVTEFDFELDAFMTFQHKITWRPSHVVREHEAVDWAGGFPSLTNLEPEPFNPPFTKVDAETPIYSDAASPYFYVVATCTPTSEYDPVSGAFKSAARGEVLSNVYSGVQFFECSSVSEVRSTLDDFASHGNLNGVIGVLTSAIRKRSTSVTNTYSQPCNITIDGYAPRHAKCLMYPFQYVEVSNHCGQVVQLAFEESRVFGAIDFETDSFFSVNPQRAIFPLNYGGYESRNVDKALIAPAAVWSPWAGNSGKNDWAQSWQAIPAVNAVLRGWQNIATTVDDFLDSEGSTLAGSANQAVAFLTGQRKMQQKAPESSGINGTPNTNFAFNTVGFKLVRKVCPAEYIKDVDDFFHRFGYTRNRLKVPNLSSRPNWNYVQTAGLNITGASIANDYKQQIVKLFDGGVTLWKNGANIGDYSPENRG